MGSLLVSHFPMSIDIPYFSEQNLALLIKVLIQFNLGHISYSCLFCFLNYMSGLAFASNFPLFIVIPCFVKQNLNDITSLAWPQISHCLLLFLVLLSRI